MKFLQKNEKASSCVLSMLYSLYIKTRKDAQLLQIDFKIFYLYQWICLNSMPDALAQLVPVLPYNDKKIINRTQ